MRCLVARGGRGSAALPRGYSCSGRPFGPGGRLYVTGDDNAELYVLQFPAAGSTMTWFATIAITAAAQPFAWDPRQTGLLHPMAKRSREVIISRIHHPPYCQCLPVPAAG